LKLDGRSGTTVVCDFTSRPLQDGMFHDGYGPGCSSASASCR
jgi:hypothetical protein